MTKEQLERLAAALREIEGVDSASPWTRVPGKERVYVDLRKLNGGRTWNGGTGRRVIIHADGRIEVGEWAGAATRNWHREHETMERVEAVVREAVGGQS